MREHPGFGWTDKLRLLGSNLQSATNIVGVGRAVCDAGRELFGVHQTQLTLNATSGRPLLMVDNVPEPIAHEVRLRYVTEGWVLDPILSAIRENHGPAGEEVCSADKLMQLAREEMNYTGAFVYTLGFPILEPGGLIGRVLFGDTKPFSDELRSCLSAVATHVSIRLVQLGITTISEAPRVCELTLRQFDVAQLAARGRTNQEIAGLLKMSENTVKKHLKDIFARAEVGNRTELASRISRVGLREDIPIGVTQADGVVITYQPATP